MILRYADSGVGHKGIVLVEDPRNTKFDSMPIAAIKENHPDMIATPATLASEIKMIIKERS